MHGHMTRASASVEVLGVTINLETFGGGRALELLACVIVNADVFLFRQLGAAGIAVELASAFAARAT